MLAELVDHVIGVDPDRDRITAVVIDAAKAALERAANLAPTEQNRRFHARQVDQLGGEDVPIQYGRDIG